MPQSLLLVLCLTMTNIFHQNECQKKFVSDTVIPEASISEVDDLCKEIAKIMRLFASEKEITLNKNEVSEIRNIFEKVLSRLTNQSYTV